MTQNTVLKTHSWSWRNLSQCCSEVTWGENGREARVLKCALLRDTRSDLSFILLNIKDCFVLQGIWEEQSN